MVAPAESFTKIKKNPPNPAPSFWFVIGRVCEAKRSLWIPANSIDSTTLWECELWQLHVYALRATGIEVWLRPCSAVGSKTVQVVSIEVSDILGLLRSFKEKLSPLCVTGLRVFTAMTVTEPPLLR